jgi:hypothetical protein
MGGTSDPPERGDDQKINEDLRAGRRSECWKAIF